MMWLPRYVPTRPLAGGEESSGPECCWQQPPKQITQLARLPSSRQTQMS